jgi:TonB-dependent receptor
MVDDPDCSHASGDRQRRPLIDKHLSVRLGSLLVIILLLGGASTGVTAHAQSGDGSGAIRGTVRDVDFNIPLSDVVVTLVGQDRRTETRENGTFLFEEVPPGRYTLSFKKLGYQRYVETGVIVTAGQLAEIRAPMAAEVYEMQEMVVTGQDLLAGSEIAQLEIRAEALTLQDAISAELMSRAGVGDVAGALNLVVGATVVEGKYATVRGLSDRYTGTTVNGVKIPSSDPRKRSVQLDVFPTGSLEAVTVTKTFTPDLPGDFTGGGVDIRTQSAPGEPTLSLSVSTEYDDLATNNDKFLTYRNGGVNAFLDSSMRDLPPGLRGDLPFLSRRELFRPDQQALEEALELDRLMESLTPVMGVSRVAPDLARGLSVLGGNSYQLDTGDEIGFFGSLSYSEDYSYYERGLSNIAGKQPGGSVTPNSGEYTDSAGSEELLVGMLGSANWRPNEKNELRLTGLWNLSARDEARLRVWPGESEFAFSPGTDGIVQSLRYEERSVASLQAQGEHEVPTTAAWADDEVKAKLDWVLAYNTTRQDEPDTRGFKTKRVTRENGISEDFSWISGSAGGFTRRVWREIAETGTVGGADLTLPFRSWGRRAGTVKLGARIEAANRELDQESFEYEENASGFMPRTLTSFETTDPNLRWSDVFLESDRIAVLVDDVGPETNPREVLPFNFGWVLSETGQDVDYTGSRRIDAFYGMAEIPVSERLTITGGLRVEKTRFDIFPRGEQGPNQDEVDLVVVSDEGGQLNRRLANTPNEDAITNIDERDVLPALTAVYEFSPEMKGRLAYSRTLARPSFRELSPAATLEYLEGDQFIGNPSLKISRVTNYDARWEWFPAPGDVLAASVFYKKITDPIELVAFTAGAIPFISPVNFESGDALGVELEARSKLSRIWPAAGAWAEDLSMGTNYTWIDTNVDLPALEQDVLDDFDLDQESRPLAGQPEFLFNFNVTYDNEDWGTEASVFLNVIGERVLSGASKGRGGGSVDRGGVPAVFEQSYSALDVKVSQAIRDHMTVSFKATNLIAPPERAVYRTPQGEELPRFLRPTSRTYSVSVKLDW